MWTGKDRSEQTSHLKCPLNFKLTFHWMRDLKLSPSNLSELNVSLGASANSQLRLLTVQTQRDKQPFTPDLQDGERNTSTIGLPERLKKTVHRGRHAIWWDDAR